MKICWDNLENIRYNNKTKKFYKHIRKGVNQYYKYVDECKSCGEPFLAQKTSKGLFCSRECLDAFQKKENHPLFGKKQSEDQRNKHSEWMKENNPAYKDEVRIKMSKSKKGELHSQWKGGYKDRNLVYYNTYAQQLSWCENIRRNRENKDILEVKCAYCGKWYIPSLSSVRSRIRCINGEFSGERRLYCSTECKKECPIYNQKKWPKGFKQATSREVQPKLRQLVFERDNYTCVKCGIQKSLHCHHIEGIRWESLESADIDKCITLCKTCHKKVHKIEGCKTVDMRCK